LALPRVNEQKPHWPVGSLVVLTGLNLLDYLDRQLLAAVLTPVKNELRLSDEQLGMLQSAFMWGTSAIAYHAAGWWRRVSSSGALAL
jgi:hypothetical protein